MTKWFSPKVRIMWNVVEGNSLTCNIINRIRSSIDNDTVSIVNESIPHTIHKSFSKLIFVWRKFLRQYVLLFDIVTYLVSRPDGLCILMLKPSLTVLDIFKMKPKIENPVSFLFVEIFSNKSTGNLFHQIILLHIISFFIYYTCRFQFQLELELKYVSLLICLLDHSLSWLLKQKQLKMIFYSFFKIPVLINYNLQQFWNLQYFQPTGGTHFFQVWFNNGGPSNDEWDHAEEKNYIDDTFDSKLQRLITR